MSAKSETAAELYNSGFNCSQSVLGAFCEEHGLEKEQGLKVAGGLGGGVRCGDICGAISGGTIVIGLVHGQYKPDDSETKKNCYAKTEEFIRQFKEKNGSCVCRELLGYDISTPEGKERLAQDPSHKAVCMKFIKSAVEILETEGY